MALAAAVAGCDLTVQKDEARAPDLSDTRTFTLEKHHLSFDVPTDWKDFDIQKALDEGADSELAKELGQAAGVAPEDLGSTFGSMVETSLVDEESKASLTIIPLPPHALRYLAAIREGIEEGGPQVSSAERVMTPVGRAARIAFTGTLGDRTSYCRDLLLELPGESLMLQSCGRADADAAAVADLVEGSLAAA